MTRRIMLAIIASAAAVAAIVATLAASAGTSASLASPGRSASYKAAAVASHNANVRVTRASANGPATVTITTASYGHMDTTNVDGSATFQEPSGNGPVWAIDNLHEKWTIVACSANPACDSTDGANYYVTLTTPNSHFSEFANPGPNDPGAGITSNCPSANAGGPRLGSGTVSGTISYSVVSNAGPDLSSVQPVQAPNTGLGAVLKQIFDQATNFSTVGPTPYSFTYANVCGAPYTQQG